jgi:thioredoxin-related protein
MKRLLALNFVLILAASSVADSPTPDKGKLFQDLTLKDALAKAKNGKKLVMVEFALSTCGNCKRLDETTFADKQVQQFIKEKTVAIKVTLDKGKVSPDLNKLITGKTVRTPTIVFLTAEGKELGRIEGYQPAKGFMDQAGKFAK